MTNEMKNVPGLRFPEFDGDWEEKKLKDISNKGMYGIGASATEFDGENVYVRITDINESSRKINNDKLTSPDKLDKKYLLNENDVLFARTGASTGKTYIHKHYDRDKNYYFAGFLIKFEFKNNYLANFIFQNTLTKRFENWVSVMSVRSGQPGINSEEYGKLKMMFPSKVEQNKIGAFFSKLDRQIELEEEKLELLEQQKLGYTQKLFSQELRFKDDSGCDYPNWKYNYLGNYMISHDEKTTENNQYPVLTSSREGLFLQKDYFTRDVASKDNTGYNVVPYGYFTYRHMSDDLVFKFNINYIVQKGIVSTLYPVFKTTSDLDNYFLKEILNNGNEFKKYALMQKQGGSRTYMYFSKLKQLKLHIPVLKEQEKISVFFKKLDSLIEKQSSKVELLKERKLGFLQKMFV